MYSASASSFLRRVLTWSGPILLVLAAFYRVLVWQTEGWWFESAGYGAQFERLSAWRASTFALGAVFTAFWLGSNAHFAWRAAARRAVPLSFFESETINRFIPLEDKWRLDRYRRRATFLVVALVSWGAGLAFSARYPLWVCALGAQNTGITDPASNFDLRFFLFELPLYEFLSRFCFFSLGAALLLVAAIYLYEDLIGPDATHAAPASESFAARHLAILWSLLLLTKAVGCLLTVPASFVSGGSVAARVFNPLDIRFGWTTAALFALSAPLLALLSGFAIARAPRARTFGIGILWMLGAATLPILLPLSMKRDGSAPQWRGALKRHIQDARTAWGLGEVERRKIELGRASEFSPLPAPHQPLPVALWPASAARQAFDHRLETGRSGARIAAISSERDGENLIYRGVAMDKSNGTGFRGRHVVAPGAVLEMNASRANLNGRPIIVSQTRAEVRFGPAISAGDPDSLSSRSPSWVLADSGIEGVSIGDFSVRAALAARFFEPQLLHFSPRVGEVAAWHRGAAARCSLIAPFLDWSEGARPIWLPGASGKRRLVWLTAGLVWSDDYPDSATPGVPGITPEGANYGRQVAVGVVDAASGSTSLYALDAEEPFMALFRRAFPGVFALPGTLPGAVAAQVRPASTLLLAQGLIWARYRQTDPILWARPENGLRPLLSPSEAGDTTLRALAGPNGAQWMLMALARLGGQVGETGAASPLSAILGWEESEFAARRGHPRLVEWGATSPIALPGLAAEPSASYVGGRAQWPPSTLISIAPRFDGSGAARGLIAARGQTKVRAQSTPPGGDLTLVAQSASAGMKMETVQSAPKTPSTNWKRAFQHQNARFETVRSAWQNLRQARQKGDWNGVGRAETRLNRALGTPW